MAAATATFCDVPAFDGRLVLRIGVRGFIRAVGMGLGSVAAIGVSAASATLAAAWLFSLVMAASPHGKTSIGPGVFALDQRFTAHPRAASLPQPVLALAEPDRNANDSEGDAGLPPATTAAELSVKAAAPETTSRPVQLPPQPRMAAARQAVSPEAEKIPLPRAHPAKQEGPPQVAMAAPTSPPAPPAQKPLPPQSAHHKAMALPGADSRTAVYDISARTVYLPNGNKLEAHSGLGEKMDDPRFIHVRMRGPTPPNVYNLALRERLFHGVQAIRLKPVDESKMFGRDGMLAHTYMLGPNGQSNGCVSFKDYKKFLNAFLEGQIDRLIVVTHLDDKPSALVARAPRKDAGRLAAVEMPDMAKAR